MLKDITLGQYFPGESIIHRADPRVKIILTIAYMVVIFIADTYFGFLMLSLFTLLTLVISGIPFKYTIKGLKPILFIMIFATVINVFFVKEGKTIFEYGFIHITSVGVERAVKMAIRLTLLIITASMLTLTTTPILLTDAIESLMKPLSKLGVPAHEIAMMMTIALRFIPTLLEETDKIMKAQAARGADFDTGNLVQRAKSFIPVLVPLFISAFRRADELATAMEARCYRGSEGRTRMRQLKFGKVDAVIAAFTLTLLGLVIYLQFM
ncbi:MAG TPA: energy-coupling factor transporter transmembrane protein EcfT [Clostridiaceae bacterium]|nr:energy-coupling factor transporter transmembrane protein EcfT [Clostridiaceae bacterium]